MAFNFLSGKTYHYPPNAPLQNTPVSGYKDGLSLNANRFDLGDFENGSGC